MTQQNKIHLDYNCKEPFWKFKKQNGEDFCKTCNHSIIDFTNLTNEEIIKIFKEQNGKTCGKFYEDQLLIDEKTIKGPSFSKIVIASAIALITTLKTSAQSTKGESAKIEQSPINNPGATQIQVDSLKEAEYWQLPEYLESTKSSKIISKNIKIYIRGTRFYIDARFPFIHVRKRLTGITMNNSGNNNIRYF